jgi:alcohol dehydrogenase (cytochrome c)
VWLSIIDFKTALAGLGEWRASRSERTLVSEAGLEHSSTNVVMVAIERRWLAVAGLLVVPFLAGATQVQGGGLNPEYTTHCASCHGTGLNGAFGPPLLGQAFHDKWQAKGSQALLSYISSAMPPGKPGSLDAVEYAKLASDILAKNSLSPLPNGEQSASRAPGGAEGNTESGGMIRPTDNRDAAYGRITEQRRLTLEGMSTVTEAMLREPDGQDWINWRRTDDGFGFSPLHQITTANVDRLQVAWTLALPEGTNQITPLVHDGVMFVHSNGTVLALDVASGDLLWKFSRKTLPVTPSGPPISQPRGIAIFGHSLIVPTLDNHMLSLDVRTGALLWDHSIQESGGVLRLTAAPLIVHGKIIQGVSGCSGVGYPGGCFIVALDAATGNEIWRFNTIARPGTSGGESWNNAPLEQRFGASVWDGGTYDPESGLVYFGTGQTYHIAPLLTPKPIKRGSADALYTDTTLALNPDTGKLVWAYQHQAREVWDLDWAFERMLITLRTPAGATKAVVTMGKGGVLDALDAKSGRYLFSFDAGLQNLITGIDPKSGAKTTDPALEPEAGKTKLVCPFAAGARSWPATAYDPSTSILYVPMTESCMTYSWKPGEGWDIQYSC